MDADEMDVGEMVDEAISAARANGGQIVVPWNEGLCEGLEDVAYYSEDSAKLRRFYVRVSQNGACDYASIDMELPEAPAEKESER